MDLSMLITAGPVILASSSSDSGDSGYVGLLFLLSGFLFYGVMYARYRNSGEHHKHERETRAEIRNLKTRDDYNRSLKGVENASMSSSNNRRVKGVNHG